MPDTQEMGYRISIAVRCGVLIWSAGMLTLTYFSHAKFDATFIASVFSGTLATFGVDIRSRKGDTQQFNAPPIKPTPTKKPSRSTSSRTSAGPKTEA